eukprot:1151399-Prorocentrum_minimum.AAC.6
MERFERTGGIEQGGRTGGIERFERTGGIEHGERFERTGGIEQPVFCTQLSEKGRTSAKNKPAADRRAKHTATIPFVLISRVRVISRRPGVAHFMISSKSDIPSPSVSGEMGLVKCLVTSSKSERPSPSLPDNIASSEHSYALTQATHTHVSWLSGLVRYTLISSPSFNLPEAKSTGQIQQSAWLQFEWRPATFAVLRARLHRVFGRVRLVGWVVGHGGWLGTWGLSGRLCALAVLGICNPSTRSYGSTFSKGDVN